MSLSEAKELLLSQLVDQELPAEQWNQVLAEVLDDPEAAARLKEMLRLREFLAPWRNQEPHSLLVIPFSESRRMAWLGRWQMASWAAAALLAGILMAAGFYCGSQRSILVENTPRQRPPMIRLTPEERSEIASAFALHESVAGPLSWYAADEATIQVAPAAKGEVLRQPVAVVLHVATDGTEASDRGREKTYVIVCRNQDEATVELPGQKGERPLRMRLISHVSQGEVSLRYAIAADTQPREGSYAAMAGRRQLGLDQASLGQLAIDDRLVSINATAWVLPEQQTP